MNGDAPDPREGMSKKLFSLSGVALGAFLAVDLMRYSSALEGQHAFDRAVTTWASSPPFIALETVLVWLPLSVHAGYGLLLVLGKRPALARPEHARGTGRLVRITGMIALIWLSYHAATFRLPLLFGRLAPRELYSVLCGELSSTSLFGLPLVAIGYLTGIAALSYHFARGVEGMWLQRSPAPSEKSRRRVRALSSLAAGLLFAWGALIVLHLATGARFLG